jgi:TonB-dependent starch-binding outer membrane protein SusC
LPSGNNFRETYYLNSDLLVKRRDNIRLQFINLAYTIRESFLKKINVQSIRVSAYVNNVGVIWRANNDGLDPEYLTGKPQRSYAFGLRATF